MSTLSADGAELYYEDSGGAGSPILFAHGLLWSTRLFDPQVAHLRGRHRCVAYDHRGQGRSATPAAPYDMETLTDDAARVIGQLGLAPCHFVGLSMGGFVGLRLAARRPDLLRSLVLVDTAADAEPRLNRPRYQAMEWISRTFGNRLLLGAIMKLLFGAAFLRDPARAPERRTVEEAILALPPDRTKLALDAVVGRAGVEELLPRIGLPALVLRGADDRAIAPARARALAAGIGGARYLEIPRAGHSATVEEPVAVNAALDAFLSGLG